MIAQIRVADYNLDNCTLALTLPPDPSSNLALASQNRTLNILPSSGRIALNIWALETSTTEIDLTTLSGRTRPRRVEKLGTIVGEFGEEKRLVRSDESETFQCGGTGTLRAFEVVCADAGDEECALEFWQEQPETVPRMGAYFIQLLCTSPPVGEVVPDIFFDFCFFFPRSHHRHPASFNLKSRGIFAHPVCLLYVCCTPCIIQCRYPFSCPLHTYEGELAFHLAFHST